MQEKLSRINFCLPGQVTFLSSPCSNGVQNTVPPCSSAGPHLHEALFLTPPKNHIRGTNGDTLQFTWAICTDTLCCWFTKGYFAIQDLATVPWVKGEEFGSLSYKLFCEKKMVEIKFIASSLTFLSWWCRQLISIAGPIEANLSTRSQNHENLPSDCPFECVHQCVTWKITTVQY